MDSCYLGNTPAERPEDNDGDYAYVDSPRTGGKYKITRSAIAVLKPLTQMQRSLLTTWLCKQRRAGTEYPIITSDTVNSVKTFQSLTTAERVERALLYFNQRVRVGGTIEYYADGRGDKSDEFELMAETESLTSGELISFLQMMQQMDLMADITQVFGRYQFAPTASGWLKIDELITRLPSTSQAFVAMWFNDATHAAYAKGIEPAITDCGYRPVRIDKKGHSNKIDDEIIAEIWRSKFLVADFTCEKEKVRRGVYFEAGFARGLGIPIVWTVEKGSFNDVHFDTRQYNHIVWETPASLRSLLSARIGAVVGDGPLKISR